MPKPVGVTLRPNRTERASAPRAAGNRSSPNTPSPLSMSNCTIFIVEPEFCKTFELIKPEIDGIMCSRYVIDGEQITGVSISDEIASPIFKSLDEVKFTKKTPT